MARRSSKTAKTREKKHSFLSMCDDVKGELRFNVECVFVVVWIMNEQNSAHVFSQMNIK